MTSKAAMDVSRLPFNALIGLEAAPADSGFLVRLPAGEQYTNHLGTVHASALTAVAEAGSGQYLADLFGQVEGLVPVVRRMEVKFRKPAKGGVQARAKVEPEEAERWRGEFITRGRVIVSVPMEVVDAGGVVVLTSTVEWFISRSS